MSAAKKPLRFVLIGLLNTAIDFGLLFGLRAIGLPLVPANMISTGAALAFSFFANRSFTFEAGRGNAVRQAVAFLAVTIFGLWVLQPLVLLGGNALLAESWGSSPALFASKVAATVVSMVWNYLLYDRVVFRGRTSPPDAPPETTDPHADPDSEDPTPR